MPRRKIEYTSEYPYHVFARSNNKENFYLSADEIWYLFINHLSELKSRFGCEIYAFVLMSNHYHLLIKTSEQYDLGQIMHWFQMSISRCINSRAERINHVFGGPYQCSQIKNNNSFLNVFKYIYRNPTRANLCENVEDYKYSLINRDTNNLVDKRLESLVSLLIYNNPKWRDWLNEPTSKEYDEAMKKGLAKGVFKAVGKTFKARRELRDV